MDTWICRQIGPSLLWLRLRLCRLVWADTTAVEIMLVWLTLAAGLQMGRGYALFELFPQAYQHMAAVLPESLWSALLLMLGSAHGTCLVVGSRRGRRVLLMLTTIVWSALAGLFGVAIPQGILPPLITIVAVACGWSYVRLGRKKAEFCGEKQWIGRP